MFLIYCQSGVLQMNHLNHLKKIKLNCKCINNAKEAFYIHNLLYCYQETANY